MKKQPKITRKRKKKVKNKDIFNDDIKVSTWDWEFTKLISALIIVLGSLITIAYFLGSAAKDILK